ncbi:flagellar motor switch protein FliN [Halobacteroides halobius DSM 5150]|uniref:Flagellar motor switch protein FliN n=1 Tax=Halobacteroides halobius (strain ATCC 35273 / DSM 5150 / MD-1) TaxID=748449 RepID=L0K7W3_HALHC|nr:flagellar motor switch phosphatase FliY [Halobacteroides halobius]AGB40640.1 flagellar motor switch protein FliN [Halobacteroides halobius DSM 5150]
MDNDVLSQDEINALLDDEDTTNNGEKSQLLSDLARDALGEIGNISMGSAATALYGLLDKKVEITAPEVEVSTLNELIDSYNRPCVLVDVQYIEGLEGSNQMILEVKDAAIITDLMMGGDGTEPPEGLDEMHLSAVGEAMNQMMGSASTSMSDFFAGNKVNISPPEAELLEVNEETFSLNNISPEDKVVQIIFDMKIGDLIDSQIVQVMTIDFAEELAENLMNPTQTEEESNQSQKETQKQPEQQAVNQQTQQRQQPRPQSQQQRRQPQSQQRNVEVQGVEFNDLGNEQDRDGRNDISLIYDVDLELTVRLGKAEMSIKEILDLGPGSVIELDRLAGEAVDLLVNGKLIAQGEVVVIDENFGFRVTDIVSSEERLKRL